MKIMKFKNSQTGHFETDVNLKFDRWNFENFDCSVDDEKKNSTETFNLGNEFAVLGMNLPFKDWQIKMPDQETYSKCKPFWRQEFRPRFSRSQPMNAA